MVLLVGALAGAAAHAGTEPAGEGNHDVQRGRALVQQVGCAGCHTIPGIRGAVGTVGPPLTKLAKRVYIAGVLPNTPQALELWLRNPPAVNPRTGMPNLGLTPQQARDIAAFLETLE